MFTLKKLSREAIPAALEKAERYRLLKETVEAQSICRDVLAVDPGNQKALITLLLALTDEFKDRLSPAFQQAEEILPHLGDQFCKAYYGGSSANGGPRFISVATTQGQASWPTIGCTKPWTFTSRPCKVAHREIRRLCCAGTRAPASSCRTPTWRRPRRAPPNRSGNNAARGDCACRRKRAWAPRRMWG